MEQVTTISSSMQHHLRMNGISISQFAQISGINSGSLSRILNGNKPVSFRELFRITTAMGLPEDHFFTSYVEECFTTFSLSWRRLHPALVRSAELNRLDCIETIVKRLLDDLTYLPKLFEVAEKFFQVGNYSAASILYRGVSETEKYQHSERLALCKYRLFLISLVDDFDANLRASTLFEPYLVHLEIPDRLDAIHNLAHVFGSLHRWEKVDTLAEELHRIALIYYKQQKLHGKDTSKKTKHPLYFYVLYSYLMRSVVCEEMGDFEKALHFVSLYEDGSWIREKSEEAERIVKQFQEWGNANKLLYRLLSGDVEVLPMYIEVISSNEDELPTALSKIVQAANQHNFNIDSILDRFSSYLPYESIEGYNKYIMAEQNAHFLIQLGIYHINNNRVGGIDCLLQGLNLSVKMNSNKNIIRCMTLYELHRHLSTSEEAKKYTEGILASSLV